MLRLRILIVFWVFWLEQLVSENVLYVGVPLNWETYIFDQPPKQYRAEGLIAGRSYEVKVSYPATIPTQINLSASCLPSSTKFASRKLQDVEKIVFKVMDDSCATVVISLKAEFRGVSPINSKTPRPQFFYNIVLEESIFGIPVCSLPVIITAVVLLMCAWMVAKSPVFESLFVWLSQFDDQNKKNSK